MVRIGNVTPKSDVLEACSPDNGAILGGSGNFRR
jgi:hypothetical protein